MHTVKFKSHNKDDNNKVQMRVKPDSWEGQATMFVAFLQAQGYIIDESDLANYYAELSDDAPTIVKGDLIVTGSIRSGDDMIAYDPEAAVAE